jgi:two-component system cell cycle response regulator DivK
VHVTTVDEALDAVISESVDLLLLDINLGTERGGVKLLQEIRERNDLADIPAIALTAFAMPGDREDLLACGFDAYVGKPFTHGELTNTIDQTLSDT